MRARAASVAGLEKREAILAAALERFSHYGFRRTAMEDIAHEAGISRAAVYLHFANKEEIFRDLARELQEQALTAAANAVGSAGPVKERLRRVLEAKLANFFELVHGSAHARELLDENSRICGDISGEYRRRYLKLVRRVLEEAVARREVTPGRVGLSAATAAELIVDCAKGLEGSGTALTPAVYRRRLEQLVQVLVAGLGGPRR